MVAHYARNGYYYQLDRTSGEFLSATQFVDKINWTAGIDPKTGKPIEYDPNTALQTYIPETRYLRGEGMDNQPACPDFVGGVRWQPQAYNPEEADRLTPAGKMVASNWRSLAPCHWAPTAASTVRRTAACSDTRI